MRPYLELVDIGLKLHNLKEISEFLKNAFENITLIRTQGESWIEEIEKSSYESITQFITDKTLEILHNCLSMTSTQIEALIESASCLKQENKEKQNVALKVFKTFSEVSQHQILTGKRIQLKTNVIRQNKEIQKLKQRLRSQLEVNNFLEQQIEANVSEIQHIHGKCLEFKEEIINELQSASLFMSQLLSQSEVLSKQIEVNKENEVLQNRNIEGVSNKIDIISQSVDNLSKSTEDIIHKQGDLNITLANIQQNQDLFDTILIKINTLEADIIEIKEKESNYSQRVIALETEIKKMIEISDGESDSKSFDDSPYVEETFIYEEDKSEDSETDLSAFVEQCDIKPGHTKFIPIDRFSLNHLPEDYRDIDLFELINSVADLTVKVSVNTLSNNSTTEPNIDVHVGSGVISNVIKWTIGKCPCETCLNSEKAKTDWWKIRIRTSSNFVFNVTEGYLRCRLFYDTEDSREVVLNHLIETLTLDQTKDWRWFDFATCDSNLVDKVDKMLKRYYSLNEKVTEKYTENRDVHKLMFIVSHPRGFCKQVNIGRWVEKDIETGGFVWFFSNSCTCCDSKGASAYFVGYGFYAQGGKLKIKT